MSMTNIEDMTKEQFGACLYRRMLERGWNQSELARQAGLTRNQVNTYVNGLSFPTRLSLHGLAQAFSCRPEDLLPQVAAGTVAMVEKMATPQFAIEPHASGKARLRINQVVTSDTARKIWEILENDPLADPNGGDGSTS